MIRIAVAIATLVVSALALDQVTGAMIGRKAYLVISGENWGSDAPSSSRATPKPNRWPHCSGCLLAGLSRFNPAPQGRETLDLHPREAREPPPADFFQRPGLQDVVTQ